MLSIQPNSVQHKKTGLWLSVLVSLAVLACGCGERGPRAEAYGHDEPQRGGTLRTSVNEAIRTLDPAIAYDEIAGYAVRHLYSTLLGYGSATEGKGTELVPQLAQSWSVSPDGRVYTFILREGLRYSDGRPLLADDFKYAFERVLTHESTPFKGFLGKVVGAAAVTNGKAGQLTGVRSTGDRQLEIELTEPDSTFPMIMAMSFSTPLSREHVEAHGGDIRANPLGTGAFKLASWNEGSKITLARNPHYWNPGLPYLDRVVMYTGVPRKTAFLKFEAGEIDTVSRLSSADYLWLSERESWKPYTDLIPIMATFGVRMNCQQPPFDNVKVRQALSYAINKQNIRKIHNGLAVIASGMLPPTMYGHNPRLEPYPYNPDRARQLLAEAGYPDGFSVDYMTFQDGPNETIAQSMQSDLRKVGVEMNIQLVSWNTLYTSITKIDGSPFSYMGWLIDYPDPSNMTDVQFHSRNIAAKDSTNTSFYKNPRLDALLDSARKEGDSDKRRGMYEEIDELLHHEAPWIWLFHLAFVEVRQPYVANYKPHPIWMRDFRAVWLDLPPDRLRDKK